MKCVFEFQWINEIQRNIEKNGEENKLRTYCLFKRKFEYEKYLNMQKDFNKRRNITKLRISAHRLEIEIGRYANKTKKKLTKNLY